MTRTLRASRVPKWLRCDEQIWAKGINILMTMTRPLQELTFDHPILNALITQMVHDAARRSIAAERALEESVHGTILYITIWTWIELAIEYLYADKTVIRHSHPTTNF